MRMIAYIVTLLTLLGAVGISQRVDGQSVLGPGMYDTKSPIFDYAGTWLRTSENASYFGSDAEYAITNGSSVTFWVFGETVNIYGAKLSTGDTNALLCVDDVCSTISLYSATFQPGVLIASVSGLTYGQHKIDLINGTSTNNSVVFDAVHVEPFQIEPTIQFEVIVTAQFSLPETTPEPLPRYMEEATVNGQPVVFENSITSGDQMQFIVLGIIAFLSLMGVLIQIWQLKSKSQT